MTTDLDPPNVVTIGIAGGTASGKSTIASAILESVGAENISHILHDSYYKERQYLPRADDMVTINFDHPDALDTDLLLEHIHRLKQGQSVDVPIYDFVKHARAPQTRRLEPRPVIIVEGILTLADAELRRVCDIKIYVDTPSDVRFIRRLKRDIDERGRTMESVISQYLSTVRPMHLAFVEPSKFFADIIIPQGGYNTVAIDLVADRIRAIVARLGADDVSPA
ncbi:MAG: uridine kinase [Anaerolineales bacterium]